MQELCLLMELDSIQRLASFYDDQADQTIILSVSQEEMEALELLAEEMEAVYVDINVKESTIIWPTAEGGFGIGEEAI
ncbi:hypothetical protein J8230_002895 [Listeria monocytogenes]|uniref:hypothetical protein n=1 Tax=Listeria monocytogenes TaxID=1639 RepID=UPI0010E949DA|nr:hypothetical protein [Listeria monocytogenes]EAE5018819.1 hypothetical protein [Listeria monocytogenes]EAE5019742.1 hypothetical protein [Listeria monocytogenes]EGF3660975.1 hypothetical protein [Listeria monocytogenes]EHH9778076.1 hypothetical protein [Listeria monocytogenes]EKL0545878.1 hypothetical protein [Listeria monocytogenes]